MSGMTPPRQLDDLLNYRLMRLLSLSGAPVIRLCEGRYGISRREWRLLALLAARGPLAPSALADEANLDRARTSRAIGSLVAKRLAARQARPGDARRAVVSLTDAGRALYDELFPQVARIHCDVLSTLDAPLLAALDEALARLTVHAAEVNRATAADVQADRHRGGSRRHWPAGG